MQVENLGLLATPFGQALHALVLTCDDLHSLWSRSNLHESRRKTFTVSPPNPSQLKLSDYLLANEIKSMSVYNGLDKGFLATCAYSRGVLRVLARIFACFYVTKSLRKLSMRLLVITCVSILSGLQ